MEVIDALDLKNQILVNKRQLPQTKLSNRFAGLNVLGLVADNSACGYYRVVNPLHYLKQHGANIEYGSHHNMDAFLKYDYIIAPRQHSEQVYEILRFVMWEGKTVIFEIDDDLDAVERTSPAYIAYHPGSPELRMIHKVMSWCDGVTTTTPDMARWCSQNSRHVGVIDNLIDFSFRDWGAHVEHDAAGNPTITPLTIEKREEWKDKIVVGYSGGTSHQTEMPILGPQIRALLKRHPHVQFALYMSPQQAQELIETYDLPKEQVTYVPARHFMDFPTGLHGFDIGLCPLACNQFNLAKSYLKPLEYMAVGAAVVASNVGPYARFQKKHPGSILLAGEGPNCASSNLIDGVEKLIKNPELLKQKQIEGRQLIYDNYSLEKNIEIYPATWNYIRTEKFKGNVGPPENKKSKDYYRTYKQYGRNDSCPCGSGKKYKACCVNAFG